MKICGFFCLYRYTADLQTQREEFEVAVIPLFSLDLILVYRLLLDGRAHL